MRVHYSEEMLARLSKSVERNELSSPADRAGLIMDAYALVKAKKMLSPESLMKLLVSFKDEIDCVVWKGIASAVGGLNSVLSADEKIQTNFSNFAKKLCFLYLKRLDGRPMQTMDI
jgi:hypothetical protein